jgi:hypothetical protein
VASSKETVNLGILDAGEVVVIDTVESPQAVRMSSKIGNRRHLHATALGKVLLAGLADKEVTAAGPHEGPAAIDAPDHHVEVRPARRTRQGPPPRLRGRQPGKRNRRPLHRRPDSRSGWPGCRGFKHIQPGLPRRASPRARLGAQAQGNLHRDFRSDREVSRDIRFDMPRHTNEHEDVFYSESRSAPPAHSSALLARTFW